jgi:glycosyltransferase involved in cell wall biosynthesis
VWNRDAYRDLRSFLARVRPRCLHVHNTFPWLSPAVYEAARREDVPVVQSLHNFRLICPNALLFRDGHVCEDCVPRRIRWPGVLHACYRGSRPASAVVATMLGVHEARGTWRDGVHVYVALTEAARRLFVNGGIPAERIVVVPNFLDADPAVGAHEGGFALFVGRLDVEKGLDTLLEAWRIADLRGRTLKVAGSGPLEASLDRSIPGIEWLGRCSNEDVLALMRAAAFLVFPSKCHEGFPMTLLEAMATGLPVLASAHGAMAEIVREDVTGRHFRTGDAQDLARALERAFAHPGELARLRASARQTYERDYAAEHAFTRLQAVYARAEQVVSS